MFKYSYSGIYVISTKQGQNYIKPLKMLNYKGIFHISNAFAMVRQYIYGQKKGKQEVFHIFCMQWMI